jgi:hypothetical protein
MRMTVIVRIAEDDERVTIAQGRLVRTLEDLPPSTTICMSSIADRVWEQILKDSPVAVSDPVVDEQEYSSAVEESVGTK